MTRAGRLWVPIDCALVDSVGNKYGIGDAAILSYIRLLAWCKQHGTDGLVPFSVAPSILNGTASDLESAGLIAVDDDEHVVIRDWHKWHMSADELADRRVRDRWRKRASRGGYVSSTSFSSPSEKERREEKGQRPDSGRNPSADRTDREPSWDDFCPHSAPYNGRGCIECRTGRDIG